MFVVDRYGQTVFFPRFARAHGYIVLDPKDKRKLEIFSLSFIWISVFLIVLILPLLILYGDSSLCTGGIFGILPGWFLLQFLILQAITKHLPVHPMSYKEIVLDNLSSDDEAPET